MWFYLILPYILWGWRVLTLEQMINRTDKLSKYHEYFKFWLKYGILIQITLSPEFTMVLSTGYSQFKWFCKASRVQGLSHSLGILAVLTITETFRKCLPVDLHILSELDLRSPCGLQIWSEVALNPLTKGPTYSCFYILPDWHICGTQLWTYNMDIMKTFLSCLIKKSYAELASRCTILK